MTLQDFLVGILSGSVLLGPILYLLFERVAFLANITAEWKRVAVAVVAGALSLAAWGLLIWLGYQPGPETRQAIAEGIWTNGVLIGFTTFTTSTSANIIHGFTLGEKG